MNDQFCFLYESVFDDMLVLPVLRSLVSVDCDCSTCEIYRHFANKLLPFVTGG
jgi:hypothetical protein